MSAFDAALWLRVSFPTPEQFRQELTHLYLKAAPHYDSRPLPTALLAEILQTAQRIYAKEFPPAYDPDVRRHKLKLADPHRAYQLTLATFLKSLVGLTTHVPGRTALGDKHTPFLKLPSMYLYKPEHDAGWRAFAEPFRTSETELRVLGVFEWSNFEPYAWDREYWEPKPEFNEDEPIYGDQYERRRYAAKKRDHAEEVAQWKERRKRYEADHKEAHEREWTPLFGTPYYAHDPFYVVYDVPLELPQLMRFEGHWILGAQGSGKTTLLKAMFHHDLEAVKDGTASIVVMDSKPEFSTYVRNLACFADGGELAGKLVVIDPSLDPAINPLDVDAGDTINTVELLVYIVGALTDKFSEMMETLARPIFRFLLEYVDDPTLNMFRQIVANDLAPFQATIDALDDEDLKHFFTHELAGATGKQVYGETKGQVMRRMRALAEHPLTRKWLATPRSRINMSTLMDGANVIVIDNSRPKLGAQGAQFLGRFFLALVQAAAMRRTGAKMPTYVYIDEAHDVIAKDEKLSEIIAQCRSHNIALIVAHQWLSQIQADRVLSALQNCAIKQANVDEDAQAMAERLGVLRQAVMLDQGVFATNIRRTTPGTVSAHVIPAPPQPMMTDTQRAAFEQRMRDRYSTPPEPRIYARDQPPPKPELQPEDPPPRSEANKKQW